MAATRSSLEVALDRVWTQRRFEEQLYEENRFLDKLKKTNRYTVGEKARVPIHVSRNGGFTSLPTGGGNLNAAGNQGYNKAEYEYTHHHQQVALQGDVIDSTQGQGNAIVEAADEEITRALNDMNRQLTRMSYLNGDGLICPCRTSSSNNVDLNLVSGGVAIERGWFFVGQPIDVGTATEETVKVNESKITAIDTTNTALTVASGNVTGEGATHFVSQANARSGETSFEANGLRNIVSETTTLGGLAPATEVTWKSTVNSTTTALTVNALLEAQQKIRQKRGKSPNFLVTGLKQQRKFYELLEQQVHYGSDKGLEAGNDESVKWNGMEIFADPDCPDEDLYMGNFDHFFIVALDQPYWQNKVTGGEKLAWIQGTDSYGGKLTYRMNIAVNRRNDLFRFSALA
jgi:hypothetical protein